MPPAGSLRVVQVNVYGDPDRRDPEALLERWSGISVPAEAAAGAGCDVGVVQAAAADRLLDRGGVRYHFTAEPPVSDVRRRLGRWALPVGARVVERVAALAPDVVHLHGLSFPRHAARLLRRMPGVPVVAQDHADRPPRAVLRPLHRRSWRGLGGLLITTRAQAEPFFESGVLPRSVPVFEVLESTTRFGAVSAERLPGDPALLWVGRLDANKDPLAVLGALGRAARAVPRLHLSMCWTAAPLLDAVRARIAGDPELDGRITLLGPRPPAELERLLSGADFLIQGSHREGSGYAVIESLACGATPLVTDVPSLRRITRDGAVGSLTPPGDVEAMARAVVDFAGRERAALRVAARAHFERHLSIAALGRELRAAYEGVVHAGAGGPLLA